nr:hypothetical protein [Mycobacteroides chelonae]
MAAFAVGGVLVVGAVAALHHLYRSGDSATELIGWAGLLLLAMTALGGGVKLAMWGVRPVTAALSDAVKGRLSEPLLAVMAAVAVIVGALGMWWMFRGGYAIWWQHLTGESQWSRPLGVGQMLVAVLAGAALFTGGRYMTGLAKETLAGSGLLIERDQATGKRRAPEGLWHPGLVAALIGGGLGLVLLTAGVTPRLYVWITGPDVFPAVAAITLVLLWAIASNLGWWKGLVGLWKWATDASQKAAATAGVVAVLMFSASGLGLGWFTPATVPQAHAACPPDCGGPGGSDGPPGGGQMFQPPSQGGPQMPDYQGGINQAPLDQNNGISIYNTQAPSVSNNGVNGSSGQQGSQQGWDQPAHGTQIPDYQNATPYTQGPGRPNPDFNGGQANPGSQGGQSNQGGQQPAEQPQQGAQQAPQQPPQQDAGQQPNQSPDQPDQQKIEDLTRQLQEKQQQSGQDRQRIDDLTKQLQQNKQNQKQQQSTKFPSKDKKKDDKDEQDDRDDQSQNTDLASLLLGAASTRRRKQDEQEQGPDTEALGQDASQAVQGLPGDVQTYVQSGQQIGQSSGQAAQGFGSAAQAGASLASSAQSGAVNPQDAITVVQGVSQGIQGTADAINAGSQIVKTAQGEADQVAQAVGDANPQLKPQTEQFTQLNDTVSKGTEGVGQVASGVSQVSGVVNSVSSMGSGGAPDTSGVTDPLSGTATAVDSGSSGAGGRSLAAAPMDFKDEPADPITPKTPQSPPGDLEDLTDRELLDFWEPWVDALGVYDRAWSPKGGPIRAEQWPAYKAGRAVYETTLDKMRADLGKRGIDIGPNGITSWSDPSGRVLRYQAKPARPGEEPGPMIERSPETGVFPSNRPSPSIGTAPLNRPTSPVEPVPSTRPETRGESPDGMSPQGGSAKMFSGPESEVFNDVSQIYNSPAFNEIRQAFAEGVAKEVNIGGYKVLYEPSLPTEGFSLAHEGKAFVMGPKAFVNETEIASTIAQETYRVNMTEILKKGVDPSRAASETDAAFSFAEKAGPAIAGGGG